MSEENTANLIHVAVFLGYMALLLVNAGNVRIPRMRMLSTLIQLSVVVLCVDLLIGFFVIERVYGSSISARWISKSMYGAPAGLVLAIAWMLRAHHRARKERVDAS